MTSSTPRVAGPRPQYPSIAVPVLELARDLGRDIVLGIALTTLLCKPIQSASQSSGLSDRTFFILLLMAVHTGTYCLFGGFYSLCDWFSLLQQYKLHRKPFMQPSRELVRWALQEAVLSHFVTLPLMVFLFFDCFKYFGMPAVASEVPPWPQLAAQLAIAHVFNDWFFYWTHRTVHHPKLYARIHKQHHTFQGTIGIAAEFASPLETFFANILPTFGGCVFFGRHPVLYAVWVFLRLQQTYEVHSGYAFTGSLANLGVSHAAAACYHDYHHTANRGNFGSPYMDWLFGTMDPWLAAGGMEGYLARGGTATEPTASVAVPRAPARRQGIAAASG